MALVTEKPVAVFDLAQVARGHLLWGRHRTWGEGKAGFVTAATKEQLVVQYYPGIGNVTNHFIIPVSEVVDGQWEIRWSADMTEIKTYGIRQIGETTEIDGVQDSNAGSAAMKEKETEQRETEGVLGNDTGGIDL